MICFSLFGLVEVVFRMLIEGGLVKLNEGYFVYCVCFFKYFGLLVEWWIFFVLLSELCEVKFCVLMF